MAMTTVDSLSTLFVPSSREAQLIDLDAGGDAKMINGELK
jgi:hypothetical protein